MRTKIIPLTNEQLAAAANPQLANQPQVSTHTLYDTQTYVSGTTVGLTFFQTVQADKSLGNMEAGGSLPSPQFFAIDEMGCDLLVAPAAQAGHAATGPINDVTQLVLTGRGFWEFVYQSKSYGLQPLSFFKNSGGATGFGWATMTAEAQVSYANNGALNNQSWDASQQIVLKPNAPFSVQIRWPAALTLAGGNTLIRAWLKGAWYRAVS